jgi:endonuclease YncB( thermonuclease family)
MIPRLGACNPVSPITKWSHRYEQLVNWLLSNPHRNLKECAIDLGYTPANIYRIVGSDLFQAMYRERAEALGEEVVHTVKTKLTGIGLLALDRMEQRLSDENCSEKLIENAAKLSLTSLGYGAPAPMPSASVHQHVHFHTERDVDVEVLKAARERRAAMILNEGAGKTPGVTYAAADTPSVEHGGKPAIAIAIAAIDVPALDAPLDSPPSRPWTSASDPASSLPVVAGISLHDGEATSGLSELLA